MSDYYDRQGNPMTTQEWAASFETRRDLNRVAESKLPNGYWISTVWLGLNHRYGDGPPLIFETMVFPLGADGSVSDWGELDSDRYSTEAEALAGHEAVCEKWRSEKPPTGCSDPCAEAKA